MGRTVRRKLPEFIEDLVTAGVRELSAGAGWKEPEARELMRNVARAICTQYARSVFYVPIANEFQLLERDTLIWEAYGSDSDTSKKFSPSRVRELAAEHALSTVQIYCIVAMMRRRALAR